MATTIKKQQRSSDSEYIFDNAGKFIAVFVATYTLQSSLPNFITSVGTAVLILTHPRVSKFLNRSWNEYSPKIYKKLQKLMEEDAERDDG